MTSSPDKTPIADSEPKPQAEASGSLMPQLPSPPRRQFVPMLLGFGVALVLVAGLALLSNTLHWTFTSSERQDKAAARPAAAEGAVPDKRFAVTPPPAPDKTPRTEPAAAPIPIVPAIEPDPIGVRPTGSRAPNAGSRPMAAGAGSGPPPSPEDSPILLTRPVSSTNGASADHRAYADAAASAGADSDPAARSRARIDQISAQASATLDALNRHLAGTGTTASGTATGTAVPAAEPQTDLLGGALPASVTPKATATVLRNRSLTLPKGTTFTCALTGRVASSVSGLVGCQVLRNVYGDDGRVLLVERGSHLDGEYRATQVKPGLTRIPVIWTRLRTPGGIVVDLDSPATGSLGEAGVDGFVDNRWGQRIGAALLVAMIDDALAAAVNSAGGGNTGTSNTFVMSNTASTSGRMGDKVLDATINLPPLIVQNQGAVVGVYVARDIDFSSVYDLQATAR
jgi:type IV secretion system protein VirB10